MTRKRFVKLIMSIGYSRDEAIYIAMSDSPLRIPYADRWAVYKAIHAIVCVAKELGEAFAAATMSAAEVARSFSDCIAAVNRERNDNA